MQGDHWRTNNNKTQQNPNPTKHNDDVQRTLDICFVGFITKQLFLFQMQSCLGLPVVEVFLM